MGGRLERMKRAAKKKAQSKSASEIRQWRSPLRNARQPPHRRSVSLLSSTDEQAQSRSMTSNRRSRSSSRNEGQSYDSRKQTDNWGTMSPLSSTDEQAQSKWNSPEFVEVTVKVNWSSMECSGIDFFWSAFYGSIWHDCCLFVCHLFCVSQATFQASNVHSLSIV